MNNDVRARIDLTEAITVQVRFADGGSPAPQPAPVTVYDNFSPMLHAISGSVTDDFEEVE